MATKKKQELEVEELVQEAVEEALSEVAEVAEEPELPLHPNAETKPLSFYERRLLAINASDNINKTQALQRLNAFRK